MAKKAFDSSNRQQADWRQLNSKDQGKKNTLGIWLGVFLVFIGASFFYLIHVEPAEPQFYYLRSEVYRRLGQEEEALEEYRKATTLEYALLPPAEKQGSQAVNKPFQQKKQGITLMRMCKEVDRNTWLPLGETDSFSSSLEKIYCLIHLARPMEEGEKIILEWHYDGVETVAAEIDDQPGYNVYDFYLTQKDWQERQGDWEALLYLSDASGYITEKAAFTITD
ncbi:MAG: hypothetical protein AAGU12_13465 [Clostridiales bacterium]